MEDQTGEVGVTGVWVKVITKVKGLGEGSDFRVMCGRTGLRPPPPGGWRIFVLVVVRWREFVGVERVRVGVEV